MGPNRMVRSVDAALSKSDTRRGALCGDTGNVILRPETTIMLRHLHSPHAKGNVQGHRICGRLSCNAVFSERRAVFQKLQGNVPLALRQYSPAKADGRILDVGASF
jgi:hypothetical protein